MYTKEQITDNEFKKIIENNTKTLEHELLEISLFEKYIEKYYEYLKKVNIIDIYSNILSLIFNISMYFLFKDYNSYFFIFILYILLGLFVAIPTERKIFTLDCFLFYMIIYAFLNEKTKLFIEIKSLDYRNTRVFMFFKEEIIKEDERFKKIFDMCDSLLELKDTSSKYNKLIKDIFIEIDKLKDTKSSFYSSGQKAIRDIKLKMK